MLRSMKLLKKKTKTGQGFGRIYFVAFCMIASASLLTYRLVTLTIARHAEFTRIAQGQQVLPSAQLTNRGNIYTFDQSTGQRKLAALTKRTDGIYTRTYPGNMFASHVLGFVGYRESLRVGQYGIEAYYDDVLTGNQRTQKASGSTTYAKLKNVLGFFKGDAAQAKQEPESAGMARDGEDIVLTIDPNIQDYAQAALNAVLKKYSSPRGSILVEDPNTGAMLAMVSSPSFDPNHYASFGLKDYPNPAMQEQYEPGSSFKAFTMAAAIDTGAVTPDTTYTDTGEVKYSNYTVRNFDNTVLGLQTMTQVLEHSLNTGVIFAQKRTGFDKFINYVVNFGFGQKTGVDLAGEVSGNISNLYENREVNYATAAFGQGIAVTSLQLINGYAAIANGGRLLEPYMVKEIVHPDGSTTPTQTKIIGSPITEKTSTTMKTMLVSVVDKGFDAGRVAGYDVAGKTGTAQIPAQGGGYLADTYIHDFVGFAPAYAPRFVVLIKIERPQGIRFASRSLSPVFADVAQYLLRYFKIPPTR